MTHSTSHVATGYASDQRLQYLTDRIEIQDLMVRYAAEQSTVAPGAKTVSHSAVRR
ncbi:hypothetical protein GCM10010129_57800 [Streptomyces fumigatiscleroticus]|nr:hypothetical protein GCM10010129_57800 [Streptomyces fumigatiscleroticus]